MTFSPRVGRGGAMCAIPWRVMFTATLSSCFMPHNAFYAPQVCSRQPATAASTGVEGVRQLASRSRLATERTSSSSGRSIRLRVATTSMSADVAEGDVVVVVGASGGIGRLVTQSLASTGKYRVKGLVRNLEKAKEALSSSEDGGGDDLEIELEQGDILDETSLGAAMKGAACVVACTGTTAFPSQRWNGGNTPDRVDNVAVGNMLRAAAAGGSLKRFVLLSSVGVTRADKFPFVILNAFGVLDAKAKGEAAVRRAAEEWGFSYSIVRPGQIKGEPFLTYSKAGGAALSPDAPEKGSAKRMVSLRQGDTEAGDVNPSSVAEVFTQTVGQAAAAGKSYTVINSLGDAPSQDTWNALFAKL